jgi:hypothetical protein
MQRFGNATPADSNLQTASRCLSFLSLVFPERFKLGGIGHTRWAHNGFEIAPSFDGLCWDDVPMPYISSAYRNSMWMGAISGCTYYNLTVEFLNEYLFNSPKPNRHLQKIDWNKFNEYHFTCC